MNYSKMKMNKNMNNAISSIYSNGSIEQINKTTLKGLFNRNYLDDKFRLTEDGKVYVISRMPLKKQCIELSLDIENITLSYNTCPEIAALNYYKSKEYIGVNSEGLGMFTVLKALMLDKLSEYEPFDLCKQEMIRPIVCETYLEALLVNLNDKLDELILSISKISRNRFESNFKEILRANSDYQNLSIEFALSMYDSITKDTFISILKKVFEAPYTYRNGWSDLTLIKNSQVYFIEVKTSDKLHSTQLVTIPTMRKIISSHFSICHIKKA